MSTNNRFDILSENSNNTTNNNSSGNRSKRNNRKSENSITSNNSNNQENVQISHKKEIQINKDETIKYNSFKNDKPNYEEKKPYRSYQDRKIADKQLEEKNKELEEIRKQKKREESLKQENFPDLIQTNKLNKSKQPNNSNVKTEQNQEMNDNFADKMKKSLNKPIVNNETDLNKFVIKPGWVSLTKEPKTNKIIYTYGEEIVVSSTDPEPNDVLYALVTLHDRRIEEYDSIWGEGAYEEKCKSPNYDYEYFDRLDENYELEMEKQKQEENGDYDYEIY
jgi:hypothetical protein